MWAGLLFCIVLVTGNPLHWGWKKVTVVVLTILMIPTLGDPSGSSRLLLTSALPLIDLEGEKWPEYRKILEPAVQKESQDLVNYPWNQGKYKKIVADKQPTPLLGQKWADLVKDKRAYTKVTTGLAMEAILANPIQFSYLTGKKF